MKSISQNSDEILSSGSYSKKQIFADCNVLRWSHRQRFSKGLQFVKKFRPKTIIDYGCGDATFLIYSREIAENKIGLEIDKNQLTTLKDRFKDIEGFTFFNIADSIQSRGDLITCFEVLEHCTDETIEKILIRLNEMCLPSGHVLISVPKETGLTLIGKQLVRKILALRKFGTYQYTEWYSFKDLLTMLFATRDSQIKRNFYEIKFGDTSHITCGHYGFNWKSLATKIEKHFIIQDVQYTPYVLPFGLVSSQVWFVCKPKSL